MRVLIPRKIISITWLIASERISLTLYGGRSNIVESTLSFYEASEVAASCWLLARYNLYLK